MLLSRRVFRIDFAFCISLLFDIIFAAFVDSFSRFIKNEYADDIVWVSINSEIYESFKTPADQQNAGAIYQKLLTDFSKDQRRLSHACLLRLLACINRVFLSLIKSLCIISW